MGAPKGNRNAVGEHHISTSRFKHSKKTKPKSKKVWKKELAEMRRKMREANIASGVKKAPRKRKK